MIYSAERLKKYAANDQYMYQYRGKWGKMGRGVKWDTMCLTETANNIKFI